MIWSCCGPRRRSSVISLRGAAGARFFFGSLPNFSICSSAQAECFDFDLIMFLFVLAFCFWFLVSVCSSASPSVSTLSFVVFRGCGVLLR
jgi:hypothetical protein